MTAVNEGENVKKKESAFAWTNDDRQYSMNQ